MNKASKEEQLKAVLDSSEYKELMGYNAGILEKMIRDDVDALCDCVGKWHYTYRNVFPLETELNNT
jgi:hypothetical protein